MNFKFNYKKTYLVETGILYIIFLSVCNIGLFLSITFNDFDFTILTFIMFWIISLLFIKAIHSELQKPHLLYIIFFILSVISVISTIYFIDFSILISKKLFLPLLTIFITIELGLIYLSYCYIIEGKIESVIEIDEKVIKKYDENQLKMEFYVDQIRKISFIHSILVTIYGGGEDYTILFELTNGQKLELFFSRKSKELIEFLKFLEQYSLKLNIFFQKIKKIDGSEKNIDTVIGYLRIDKKKAVIEWLIYGGIGLLAGGLILIIPGFLAYFGDTLNTEYPGFVIICLAIFIFLFFLPLTLITIGVILRKKLSKTENDKTK